MKTIFFSAASLILLSAITVSGQESMANKENLTYSSPFEKQSFDNYFLHKEDLFALFMANGHLLNEESIRQGKERFYAYLKSINTEKLNSRKNDKKIKIIYDGIHETFLKKYEMLNHFEEIFYNGYYNCVSATALYALAFDYLGIPYAIKEKPTHVYLVAYPEREQIIVETTDPVHGYFTINPAFKQNFIKTLKEQKIISGNEYVADDVNSLFDKYYFNNEENISLANLAGIQYMNDALYKYDEKKVEDAFVQIEKANILYPSERTAYTLMTMGVEALHNHKEHDKQHARYLAKLSTYGKYGITPEMIQGEFSFVINDLLFEKGKKDELASYYNELTALLDTAEFKDEIAFNYNYENGRYLYNQGKYKDCLPFFEKCLEIKPNQQDAVGVLISALAIDLSSSNDNLFIISTLEDYTKRFTALKDNNKFKMMLATCYVAQFGFEYELEKPAQGDKYKILFENYMKDMKDVAVSQGLIGQSYSIAAVYYFKKGQTSKAKKLIAEGLAFAPNSHELIIRKKMIEQ